MVFAEDILSGNHGNLALKIVPGMKRREIGIALLNTTAAGRDILALNNQDWTRTYLQLMGDMRITRH